IGSYVDCEASAGRVPATSALSFLLELSSPLAEVDAELAAGFCFCAGASGDFCFEASAGPSPLWLHIPKMQMSFGNGLREPFCRLFNSAMYSSTDLSL